MKFILFCILIFPLNPFFQKGSSTEALLKNPFDLQKFKKEKGPSNSGVADVRKYYFKPQEKGIYFYFFLFRSSQTFVYKGTEDKKTIVRSGTGFRIVTYKPLGKYRDSYFDPTETLIEVEASYNDPDLPELAFVGLDTISVKKKLGVGFVRKANCFLYSKNENVLVLNITDGVVRCLKYARLNKPFSKDDITKLTELNCVSRPIQ